jgi:ubiquinone/menaquinone biosynthesis C-methylase UbiE
MALQKACHLKQALRYQPFMPAQPAPLSGYGRWSPDIQAGQHEERSMADQASLSAYKAFELSGWQRAASRYADSFERIAAPFAEELIRLSECRRGHSVLDVACGNGTLSSSISSVGAEVRGVDFSSAMIAVASRRHPDLRFDEGDAEALPFEDALFDRIVIGFGVHHFPAPNVALQEAWRVVRPGGRVAFSVWSAHVHAIQQLPLDAIRFAGKIDASLPAPPRGDINTEQSSRSLLEAAGFENVVTQKTMKLIEIESASQLLSWLEQGTARASALIRTQPPQRMSAIKAALQKSLGQYEHEGQFLVPAVAILAAGTRTP